MAAPHKPAIEDLEAELARLEAEEQALLARGTAADPIDEEDGDEEDESNEREHERREKEAHEKALREAEAHEEKLKEERKKAREADEAKPEPPKPDAKVQEKAEGSKPPAPTREGSAVKGFAALSRLASSMSRSSQDGGAAKPGAAGFGMLVRSRLQSCCSPCGPVF